MKKMLAILLMFSVFVIGCGQKMPETSNKSSNTSQDTSAVYEMQKFSDNDVVIRDSNLRPDVMTVQKGTKVSWVNKDDVKHTVSFDGFGSGIMPPNSEYSRIFSEQGIYEYVCLFHPSETGVVVVER